MRWDSLRGTVPSYFLLFKGFVTIHGLAGSLRSFRTQARWRRIPRKRGQGIRKLTPKNVRVHRESALHLALSKEWISRTSLTAPKIVCFVIRFHPACCVLVVQTHKNAIHHWFRCTRNPLRRHFFFFAIRRPA